MAGEGEVARPLPAAPAAARADDTERSAPRLLCFLRKMLVCGKTGSPGGLRLTNPTHVSFKPVVAAFTSGNWKPGRNKGGGAEPAWLEARDWRDTLIPQMSEPARQVPEPGEEGGGGETRVIVANPLRRCACPGLGPQGVER